MSKAKSLHALLEQFGPTDAAQRGFVQRMRALIDDGDAAFERSHFSPGHFTASAFVLSPDGRSLLLILHGKLHRWLQPGGHVDREDTDIIAAARRELAEEVNLHNVDLVVQGIYDVDIHAIPKLLGEPAHEHFDVRFLFRSPSDEVLAGTDAAATQWVPIQKLAEGNVTEWNSDESVIRAVRNLPKSLVEPRSDSQA